MNYSIAIAFFSLSFFQKIESVQEDHNRSDISANTIVFSPDGSRLLLSLKDSTAVIMDAASGKTLLSLRGHKKEVNTANYSPDGNLVLTTSLDKTAKIWNAITGELVQEIRETNCDIRTAKFSPDGKRILTVCGGTIKIWKTDYSKPEFQITDTRGYIFTDACFSSDSKSIFTGSVDNSVKKWVIGLDQPVQTMLKHTGMVTSVCISPDGIYVISASLVDGSLHIWNARQGSLICSIPVQLNAQNLQCSKDGKYFLFNTNSAVAINSFSECKMSSSIFDAKELIIEAAAFSPDGKRIVTVSMMGTIKYWDALTANLLATLN